MHSKNSLTYYNLGTLYSQNHRYEDSLACYKKAIKFNSKIPKYFYNLAWTQVELVQYDIAKENYKKAIELNPNVAKYFYNLAWIQTQLREYDSAIGNYKRAISIKPDYSEAKYKLSLIYLSKENFSEGWKNFEARIKIKEANVNQKVMLTLNQWNGEKFDGTLYVHGEQGVGDQILHSSLLADLYKRHSDICLIIDDRLVSLFRRSFKTIMIVGYKTNLKFGMDDKHILVGSLGKILRKSINNFKEKPPAFIIPDQAKLDEYKKILSQNNKIKVGISWHSIGRKNQDKNLKLEQLLKILTLDNFEFINLQYGETSNERKSFENKFGVKITNYEHINLMDDFENLVALINSCDLILTISNTTAHLAGSIGKTTYLLLSKYSLWYWLMSRPHSLWYPNVKLFRQTKYGVWQDVIDRFYDIFLNYKNT